MPIAGIAKRRLGTNPRRRFLIWYQSGHFTAKPPAKKQVFVQYLFGGGEGSRTPVRKSLVEAFSECSRSFGFPSPGADRQAPGCGIRLGHDRADGISLFTFTAKSRPYPGRGVPGRDGSLIRLRAQQYCCRLFLNCGFYSGSAPLLAYQDSQSPSKPLRPHKRGTFIINEF